jgi:hypothetical protein
MASVKPSSASAARPSTFAIACWVLSLIAFSQILIAAIALAAKFEDARQVRTVIKEVPKLVAVRIPAADPAAPASPAADRAAPLVSRPPTPRPAFVPPEDMPLPAPDPVPLSAPQVQDPLSERLVKQARQARVAGDMVLAIVKLEEALTHSKNDPNVHYELGLVHEQMGVFDVAGAHFEKVFQMGVSGAGSLYELAAAKLRDGFEQPEAMLGKLSLGRVQIFNDLKNEAGQRTVLTIPVQRAPGETIDPGKVSVEVLIFNRTSKGEILQLEDRSWSSEQWLKPPFDWADGEETLRTTYVIPPQDGQTEHLFGEYTYYGQVVILRYDEHVLDVQAWPRDLAARIPAAAPKTSGEPAAPEIPGSLPPDFDPNLPIPPP